MDYFAFVLAAYLATAAVLAGLVIWVVADGRAQARALAELDRTGIHRGRAEEP